MRSGSSSTSTPPGDSDAAQASATAAGAGRWASRKPAYTSDGDRTGSGAHTSARTNPPRAGCRARASVRKAGEASTPTTNAPGTARASMAVVWPGPQPRSTTNGAPSPGAEPAPITPDTTDRSVSLVG